MIALAEDCLLFQTQDGGMVPLTADMITIEVLGPSAGVFDPEFVTNVTKAVFHYFQHQLGRESVTAGEFAAALEKALESFKTPEVPGAAATAAPAPVVTVVVETEPEPPPPSPAPVSAPAGPVVESDLRRLASEAGDGLELVFFPRLRAEVRAQLDLAPRVLRFRGLRSCAMTLTGARRWSGKCQSLSERIVVFLRGCATAESPGREFSLVIE